MDKKVFDRLHAAAQDGDRVIFTPVGAEKSKTLWAGMGNRSGLHSFASVLLAEKYEAGKDRFTQKLERLTSGTLSVLEFQNVTRCGVYTRDGGRWVTVLKFVV
ncbi:MAG: hypothetical protein NUV49_00900 [Patescibacteria group bacterium]|nr:hypothetical protein [Patescibacteria group bacterium]